MVTIAFKQSTYYHMDGNDEEEYFDKIEKIFSEKSNLIKDLDVI